MSLDTRLYLHADQHITEAEHEIPGMRIAGCRERDLATDGEFAGYEF